MEDFNKNNTRDDCFYIVICLYLVQSEQSNIVFWFLCSKQGINKESGEIPERSGHCKWKRFPHMPLVTFLLGRCGKLSTHKSGDLPKCECVTTFREKGMHMRCSLC